MDQVRQPGAVGQAVLPLVTSGVPLATVVVGRHCDETTRAAAQLLVEYVRRTTGATLPLLVEDKTAGAEPLAAVVFVGPHRGHDGASARTFLKGLSDDGFGFWPGQRSLTLAGRTSVGTEFAVVEFVERFCGVRWLMPGPDGEDVPRRRDLVVPLRAERHQPASRSRMIMSLMSPEGLAGRAGFEWGRRNRLYGAIEFMHAMWRILPPAKYVRSHPAWYPPRMDPDATFGWQPCFSDPGTAAAAVDEIDAYCDRHPDATSVSLAVNDYSGFHPRDLAGGDRNSAGYPSASAAYFGWVNQVAERVHDRHPHLTFGVLAYHDVIDPPPFDLHPSVVPFITGDRIAWSDPEIGDHGRRLTAAWSLRASELGWWEYLHGASYLVPKVSFDQFANNCRFAADHHVVHHFAETWPDWGGGPQLWMTTRLLWDPDNEPAELLDEWCRRVAGRSGAADLVAYYRGWERFWRDRALASTWFEAWRNLPVRSDYLRFDDPRYLDSVDDRAIREAGRRISGAWSHVRTPPQRRRMSQIRGRWRYYAATRAYYLRTVRSAPPPVPASEDQALELLATMIERFRAGRRILALLRDLTPNEALERSAHLPTVPDRVGLGATFGPGAVSALLSWCRGAREPTRCLARLTAVAEHAEQPLGDYAALIHKIAVAAPNLFVNPAFAEGSSGWEITTPTHGRFVTDTVRSRAGSCSLRADGVSDGSIGQTLSLRPGRYGFLVHFWCPDDTARATLRLTARHRDHEGDVVRIDRSAGRQVQRTAGAWDTAEWVFSVPNSSDRPIAATHASVEFTTVIEGNSLPSMGPDDQLILDEVSLHRLHD